MNSQLLKNPEMHFGANTFFAKQHKGDTCGSNGLPLTPNSIIIYGKAQLLKTLKHPNLCQYLDIIRGKHERTIVVSQYCGNPLLNCIGKNVLQTDDIKKIAYQVLLSLSELHKRDIVHRNLSSENILLQTENNVKLFDYGLYYMTGQGTLITFPIIQPLYSAPEVYLLGPAVYESNSKVDIWSVGIVLTELCLNKSLWTNLNLGQRIRKIISLVQCNTSVLDRIAREHNAFEAYQNLDGALKDLIEDCLCVDPSDRPSARVLLQKDIFEEFRAAKVVPKSKVCEAFEVFTINELYHWWQLAGGDVYVELKKQGLIRSSPPILTLPCLVTLDGTIHGQERNPATLYDPRVVKMPMDTLYQRLQHIPLSGYYPLIHNKSKIIAKFDVPLYEVNGLPLIIRERDPEYQFHRVILLRRLLHGYPFTKDMITKEAEIDIPPLLRGEIWAALLNVKGDIERDYLRIDKETPTATDRQIEVDIPRCHQYNELLSSGEGHRKLKRILKAWVYKNSQYVYWQGLDSLTAPFLYLNFNNEAKAFACLSQFVPKYLHKFFLKDNSAVIQEYLAKFSQLIAFHDPILANHLHEIEFIPQLFAIPWFLTMFSHVFPLHKILHLWDKLLLRDSSFSLHIGLAILTELRHRLLSSCFNECILLFSDLPEVDIEKCVLLSVNTYNSTPRSITARSHQNDFPNRSDFDMSELTVNDLNKERCPRISVIDLVDLIRNQPEKVIVVDIRNPVQFSRCGVIGSINIPFSSVKYGEANIESIGVHSSSLKNNRDKNIVVVGTKETDIDLFPKFLLQYGVGRVCILHGGFDVLLPVSPTILSPIHT